MYVLTFCRRAKAIQLDPDIDLCFNLTESTLNLCAISSSVSEPYVRNKISKCIQNLHGACVRDQSAYEGTQAQKQVKGLQQNPMPTVVF